MQVTFFCWTIGPDERLAVDYVDMVSSIYQGPLFDVGHRLYNLITRRLTKL